MSRNYREKFGCKSVSREEIRAFTGVKFPENPDGTPVYVTEQGHMKECDVNEIIRKYDSTGLIMHVNRMEAMYLDVPSVELMQAMELQRNAAEAFMQLPASIRDRFRNNPVEFLAFLEDPKNHAESVELGLRKPLRTDQDRPGAKEKLKTGRDSGETKKEA
jgi:phage internal scaffolding protein